MSTIADTMTPGQDWNTRYATGDVPWDIGEPSRQLVDFVQSYPVVPGRALDVGCGTGTNALWLARQGFEVFGVDISDVAIDRARARMDGVDLPCRFATLDFLNDTVPGGPFSFVFDSGCFHVFDDASYRVQFAERVAAVLDGDGLWLSLIGSTEGPERDHGPPRRSLRDVANAVEPSLEIVEIRSFEFIGNLPTPAAAWQCLSRRRRVPAQPSTRREAAE